MNTFVSKQWQTGEQLPAAELNRIEQGIVDAHSKIDGGDMLAAAQSAAAEAVAASSVVGAARVQGGRLIFTRENGDELDAGQVQGATGETGAAGAGHVFVADMAALDEMHATARVMIGPVDIGYSFENSTFFGVTGVAIVDIIVTQMPDGLTSVAQLATLFEPAGYVVKRVMRVRTQNVGFPWSTWTGWYDAENVASQTSYGVVRYSTNAETQAMTSGTRVVTPQSLAAAAASAATAQRLMRRDASGRAQVATPSAAADIATKGYADTGAWAAVPASATAAGTAGARAYDASWLYVCVAANTWRRVALGAW